VWREESYLSVYKIEALVRRCPAHFRMAMTWILTSQRRMTVREKYPRRTQICNADATRKIEQLPSAMHRDP